jgi:hypothetical protein
VFASLSLILVRRAFFETRFARVLDALGYARLMHWRILGNKALAKRDVALWLGIDALTLEYVGETLSRYEVEYLPGSARAAGKLKEVRCLELIETVHGLPQLRLFGLEEALGADGWFKALKLEKYAPRRSGQAQTLQEVLFPYASALT